jgi:hypothetical protein
MENVALKIFSVVIAFPETLPEFFVMVSLLRLTVHNGTAHMASCTSPFVQKGKDIFKGRMHFPHFSLKVQARKLGVIW